MIETLPVAKFDKSNVKKSILSAFQLKLKQDKNWYRVKRYMAYKLGAEGTMELGVVAKF